MRTLPVGLLPALVALALASCTPSTTPTVNWPQATAPVARVEPKTFDEFGKTRTDNYYWLRDDARKSPEVIDYLKAENAYTDSLMAPTATLRKTLFTEIKGRIKQTDESVPYQDRGYWYYTRFEDGKNYPIYCRKKGSLEGAEEVLIDVNAEAVGKAYYSAFVVDISDDNNLALIADNQTGDDLYRLRVKDLAKGTYLPDAIEAVAYANATFTGDPKVILYSVADETQRPTEIRRHTLGTPAAADATVFLEKDNQFSCGVSRSTGRGLIFIGSGSTTSSEVHLLPATTPTTKPTVVHPREKDHEYSVDEYAGTLYIRTNWEAKNFRLMTAPLATPGKANWKERIAHRPDVLLEGIDLFKDHLVVSEKKGGLAQLRIIQQSSGQEHYIEYQDPAYTVGTTGNADPETQVLRFAYASMTTPNSTYDYDMVTKERKLLKQQEVLGGTFSPENYTSERILAKAADGTEVPISLVYRKDRFNKGQNPLWVYAYGSYGYAIAPNFSSARLSLLDRGVVFAILHVRGGDDLGRAWYEDGKLMKKKNTFTDFIACTQHLVAQGYGHPKKVVAQGGSAGGLLMGAISNMAPQGLYTGIVAQVPFVDVITTMRDASIPLTTGEWEEWGNPITDQAAYDYMLSYSPYDNVTAKAYPHLLVTTSLNDSRVAYWEPAKWVAKLRTLKTDSNALLLKTDLDAGHGGGSGRDKQYEDTAFTYAFGLWVMGVQE